MFPGEEKPESGAVMEADARFNLELGWCYSLPVAKGHSMAELGSSQSGFLSSISARRQLYSSSTYHLSSSSSLRSHQSFPPYRQAARRHDPHISSTLFALYCTTDKIRSRSLPFVTWLWKGFLHIWRLMLRIYSHLPCTGGSHSACHMLFTALNTLKWTS